MSNTYVNFNSCTFEGVISNVKVVDGQHGKFAVVTLITHTVKGDEGFTIEFKNSNGLISMFEGGWLPKGRRVLVVGRISEVSETYETDGEFVFRKRPMIKLTHASVPDGGFGPMPSDKKAAPAKVGKVIKHKQQVAAPTTEEITPPQDQLPEFAQNDTAEVPF